MTYARRFGIVLVFMFLIVGQNAYAKDCWDTAMKQYEMNRCAGEEAKKADAELDDVYKKLMSKITPEWQAKLQASREAWIIYRQKQCEFTSWGTVTGTVHTMVIVLCHAELADQQTKLLKSHMECEEGDLTCIR